MTQQDALTMLRAGRSLRFVAAAVGRSPNVVRRWAQEAGVQIADGNTIHGERLEGIKRAIRLQVPVRTIQRTYRVDPRRINQLREQMEREGAL